MYEKWCVECHGETGRGDGPAADHMLPRPRDFVQARYQIRTTENGELPTTEDLRRVLREGMPGTAMPDWRSLTREESADVVAYIKTFSRFFDGPEPEPLPLGSDPGGSREGLASGREVYDRLECFKCHGEGGRGNGRSTPSLEDWRKLPIRAADLTEPWLFNGGSGAEAIHARVLTGLDGTPMPAYGDALASGVVSEDELWDLAHYVESLAPGPKPAVRDIITATRRDAIPAEGSAGAWESLPPQYVPLVGQVIRKPRQFSPTVDGIWVRAVHDGQVLALRIEWDDPSRSPDPAWDEWQSKIASTLFSDEPAEAAGRLGDGLAVQFPPELPEGTARPYFLLGSDRDPVYLWIWTSTRGRGEATGRGLERLEPLAETDVLDVVASHDEGRWRVTMRRPLREERPAALALREGVAIPIAFFAWDGSSAETLQRGSVSGWYSIVLEAPTPPLIAYGTPLIAVLVTIGAGLAIVAGANRRDRRTTGLAPHPEAT